MGSELFQLLTGDTCTLTARISEREMRVLLEQPETWYSQVDETIVEQHKKHISRVKLRKDAYRKQRDKIQELYNDLGGMCNHSTIID